MTCRVELTQRARDDLKRLYSFLLEREASRDDGDWSVAGRVAQAIAKSFALLECAPIACRPVDDDPFLRELAIPFGASGYVALFEIEDVTRVRIVAVRRQLEDGFLD